MRLSLSGNLSGSWPLDALRDALSAQLAPHGLAAEVPAALAGLQSSVGLQGGGALTLLLRFFTGRNTRPRRISRRRPPASGSN
ncbi:hypothetical protein JOS77_09320 [Chromobacterium haemolyticum]|nr:hypothetical protein JOS77_09320 [Chromobacterium haemolyticum]